MRQFRLACWLLIGVFLGGSASFAFAETVPATCGPTTVYRLDYAATLIDQDFSSCASACAAFDATLTAGHRAAGYSGQLTAAGACQLHLYGSPVGGPVGCTTAQVQSCTCPSGGGWSLNGSSCTRADCLAPAVRLADGSCGANCVVGQKVGSMSFNGAGGGACMSGACMSFNGCAVGNCASGISAGTGAATINNFGGCSMTGDPAAPGAAVGTASSPTPPPVPTPQGCVDQGKGYITNSSGTTVCLSPGAAPNTTTTTKATGTTATGDPANPTTTQKGTTTTQTCDDRGDCTVTKTTSTTTTPPGGAPTTTTKNDTQDRGSFCEENPSSSMCKETPDPCEDNPDRIGCLETGEPTDPGDLQTSSLGVSSITVVSVPSNNSCPADINGPRGVVFSYQPICTGLGWFRYVVLAVAWLGAGMIVIGAAKNG